VTALDNAGHRLQDRQQFVLGGLQDDHLSTFDGLCRRSAAAWRIFTTACIFAVFWPQNGLDGVQIT
jgi:hypothetical protein